MSLQTPLSVQKLQKALEDKARAEPSYRFYLLYDKVWRSDVLWWAWRQCRENGGSSGVDGQKFEDIEQYGLVRWLGEISNELRERTYQPSAVRRVLIPKPDGKQRPLGIPTIKDRVIQTAVMVVLTPIFEVDTPNEQYAYREKRSALDAIGEVQELSRQGYKGVVDADLSGYFDSIPHAELMRCLARRISDRYLLRLLMMWLEMAVEEEDDQGRKQRTNRAKRERRGTPQGAPISPLLANLYMRRFILGWKKLGWECKLQARIVNYADDFVIMCRGNATQAREHMQKIMEQLKLTVNLQKTKVCQLPKDSFDFLGYTVGRRYSRKNGHVYIGLRPSPKRVQRICSEISFVTNRAMLWMEAEEMVGRLNAILRGWGNYFNLGDASRARGAVDAHTRYRLRQWLSAKHKLPTVSVRRYPDEYLYEKLSLYRLIGYSPRQ